MENRIKIQSTSETFQQDAMFIADQMQSRDNGMDRGFKSAENLKGSLSSALQKKINPRLLIL